MKTFRHTCQTSLSIITVDQYDEENSMPNGQQLEVEQESHSTIVDQVFVRVHEQYASTRTNTEEDQQQSHA
jgi:hypothetical protein